jgi:hypothetical protein
VSREDIWRTLFARTLEIIDAACTAGMPNDDWSFGGGTVLMLRHRHRFSRDIDIFLPEPQYLGFLTPRLNSAADPGMVDYLEQHGSIKIYYPEGEVDFVAAPSLTANPVVPMEVAERTIRVETSVEIVAKKVRFRARDFKARDLFDLAVVLQREPDARPWLADLLTEHSATIRHRLESMDQVLRADFAQLDLLGSQPDYDECLSELEASLRSAK